MTGPDLPQPPERPEPLEPPPESPSRRGRLPGELPRGCNPLTFGVVAATLEMAVILWLLRSC